MRSAEPKYIKLWREIAANPPRCCYTCDYFTKDGKCDKYNTTPPAHFAASVEQCPDWVLEVPF